MALITNERVFGKKRRSKEYRTRLGAYTVILDDDDRIAVVVQDGRYYLPGGGVEEDEDPIQALHREVAEEVGWIIEVEYQLGSAREFVDLSDKPYGLEREMVFFPSKIVSKAELQKRPEYKPKWVTLQSFEMTTALLSHHWAAGIAIYVSKRPFMSKFDDVID
jgi:8-oxo-dGTP diphosphatase